MPRPLLNRIIYVRSRLIDDTVLIWKDERFQKFLYNCYLWNNDIKCVKEPIKLMLSFFTFLSDNPLPFTHANLESFAQIAINDKDSQICIASETSAETLGASYAYNDIAIFGGENVEASTFVVKTDNETELLRQFKRWNIETISNWSNYQKIAIHITTVDSKEPKNGENLFNMVFDDVKLITRYLSGNAASSVLSSHGGLQRGSIYAIIGFVNEL
ncbi:hypothetical protein X798_04881 [Onchocerca flexuosa]|uniref:Uncharacterized protein n=1 Tax=Onchocerca flexuosa TaxID=387005 RepID=A0A238BTU1_9BILA|nr:hypothetical protein X798_04881 [Onchocerca flexuosa]